MGHGTPVNLEHQFFRTNRNKVMMNQYNGCACYHMDPEKPDRAALDLEERNQDILHLQFQEGKCSNLTAQNLAYVFSDFGDFHVFKDTKDSAILNFYYMDQQVIGGKTIQSFITFISQPPNMD